MELFVNDFWPFMLDLPWSWLALKPMMREVAWFISLTLVHWELFYETHMNDCSQPGAGSDAKANVVVAVGCPLW